MTQALEQGGVVFQAIFALSFVAWTLIAWKYLQFREHVATTGWWARVIERTEKTGPSAALELVGQRAQHPLAVLTARAIRMADAGEHDDLHKQLAPAVEGQALELRRHLPVISALGTVAPLLGLLGTVGGMIKSFSALAAEGAAAEAAPLADGISEALLTTQAGLVVALPIVLAHRGLVSKTNRHVDELTHCSKRLKDALCPA